MALLLLVLKVGIVRCVIIFLRISCSVLHSEVIESAGYGILNVAWFLLRELVVVCYCLWPSLQKVFCLLSNILFWEQIVIPSLIFLTIFFLCVLGDVSQSAKPTAYDQKYVLREVQDLHQEAAFTIKFARFAFPWAAKKEYVFYFPLLLLI